MEYIISESQLEFLTNKVKIIYEGVAKVDNPNYTLTADGSGWLKDSRGKTMCVKVESFLGGTFAQGIKDIKQSSNGNITIYPTGSKIGDIEMNIGQLKELANSVLSNKPYSFTKKGATITIGGNLVDFCKKEWSKK
jgi:hypothetical protein